MPRLFAVTAYDDLFGRAVPNVVTWLFAVVTRNDLGLLDWAILDVMSRLFAIITNTDWYRLFGSAVLDVGGLLLWTVCCCMSLLFTNRARSYQFRPEWFRALFDLVTAKVAVDANDEFVFGLLNKVAQDERTFVSVFYRLHRVGSLGRSRGGAVEEGVVHVGASLNPALPRVGTLPAGVARTKTLGAVDLSRLGSLYDLPTLPDLETFEEGASLSTVLRSTTPERNKQFKKECLLQ